MFAGEELLVVVGPTASGKSELALKLAERRGGEIISADSVQVYRHFDIGAAKPTAEEQARIPHHLIDIVEPNEAMDAARWASLADAKIAEIRARGRLPIVCGGTFLWVKSLIWGLSPMPAGDASVRERHREMVLKKGGAALHALLLEVDPVAAARLNANDVLRVSRALEVHELTGMPLSTWQEQHQFKTKRYTAELIGVARLRDQADARILARTLQMLERGWVEEVRGLLDSGFAECRAMNAVGYRQIKNALLSGGVTDTASLATDIARATRIFARRQRTWLREQPVRWWTADELAAL